MRAWDAVSNLCYRPRAARTAGLPPKRPSARCECSSCRPRMPRRRPRMPRRRPRMPRRRPRRCTPEMSDSCISCAEESSPHRCTPEMSPGLQRAVTVTPRSYAVIAHRSMSSCWRARPLVRSCMHSNPTICACAPLSALASMHSYPTVCACVPLSALSCRCLHLRVAVLACASLSELCVPHC